MIEANGTRHWPLHTMASMMTEMLTNFLMPIAYILTPELIISFPKW